MSGSGIPGLSPVNDGPGNAAYQTMRAMLGEVQAAEYRRAR